MEQLEDTEPASPTSSAVSDDFAALLEEELAAQTTPDDVSDDQNDDAIGDNASDDRNDSDDDDGHEGNEDASDDCIESAVDEEVRTQTKVRVVAVTGSCPPHPGYMWGVCIRCGVLKSSEDGSSSNVALRYIHEAMELSEEEAARQRNTELTQILDKKKLYLVLDLDHTLLNSARFIDVTGGEEEYLESVYFPEGPADFKPGIQAGLHGLYKLNNFKMWTKLRPYAHQFLLEASKLFEMYLYTMGERPYALAMADLLDPKMEFFQGRVISNRDSTNRFIKDLDIVLGAESAVVILDDTEGVWPRHRSNLIVMERYHFFRSSCRQFRMQDISLTSVRKDESDLEGSLAKTLDVLRMVHEKFFNPTKNLVREPSYTTGNVPEVMQTLRLKILEGCHVLFSRVFPMGLPDPSNEPFWKLTEELGAVCSSELNKHVTHVIALDQQTEKARWAKKTGRFLVHPHWIEHAQYRWERAREEDYPVVEKDPILFPFFQVIDIDAPKKSDNGENFEGKISVKDVIEEGTCFLKEDK